MEALIIVAAIAIPVITAYVTAILARAYTQSIDARLNLLIRGLGIDEAADVSNLERLRRLLKELE